MSIKPSADEIHFQARPDERNLVMRLAEAFNASHGHTHGDLSFWILEPTSRTRERFGLQKEVLAIYSRHLKTDARVLTAIENLIRHPDLKHRVEKSIFLLVHCGDAQDGASLARSDLEKVIISFQAKELLEPGRGDLFVRSRMAETLGTVDLFDMSSPITSDPYFFGRRELVQQLSRRLSVQRQNAGLFGLRKTGKTSVLLAIRRALDQEAVLVDYFDCQNPSIHGARWWHVLGNISSRLRDTLARLKNRKVEILGRYDTDTAGTGFSSDIQRLVSEGGINQVIIMLDEIEWITPGISGHLGRHWDQDFLPFWQTIRATHQEAEGHLTFLVAGVNPSSVQRSHFGVLPNPVFQLATPHYLEPFSVESVREMLHAIGRRAGLRFEDGVPPALQRHYGGHPFLIRVACSEVWRQNRSVDAEKILEIGHIRFEGAHSQISARLSQPIKDILLSLVWWYPDEYDVLQILAEGDSSFLDLYLKDNQDSLLQFANYGLLRENGAFAIEDVRDFIRVHGNAYKREISPFLRGEVQPGLLPSAPDLAVLTPLFEKKVELEGKLRRLISMYLGVRFAWNPEKISKAMSESLSRPGGRQDADALFVGRTPQTVLNDLFLLDLKSIIVRHWDLFKNIFDDNQARFEMNMDAINRARRADSHPKPITSAEAEEFENSYQWVLGRLAFVPLEGGEFGVLK